MAEETITYEEWLAQVDWDSLDPDLTLEQSYRAATSEQNRNGEESEPEPADSGPTAVEGDLAEALAQVTAGEDRAELEAKIAKLTEAFPTLPAESQFLAQQILDNLRAQLAELPTALSYLSDDELAAQVEQAALAAEDARIALEENDAKRRPERAKMLEREFQAAFARHAELRREQALRKAGAERDAYHTKLAAKRAAEMIAAADRARLASMEQAVRAGQIEPWDYERAKAEASVPATKRDNYAEVFEEALARIKAESRAVRFTRGGGRDLAAFLPGGAR